MSIQYWSQFPKDYRKEEMGILANWISSGVSGSVIGFSGFGRATLLGYLCYRPEILQAYIPSKTYPVILVPVDLNNIPEHSLATFYRIILRSFFENRETFSTLAEMITNLYRKCEQIRDPFVPQSALRELLLSFQSQQTKVVFVLNRFDKFCESTTPQITDTLRGLRDSFKDTLSYIVGMRDEVEYLSDIIPAGTLYEILDTHVCWVGPLSEKDARNMISRQTRVSPTPLNEKQIVELLTLTGGHPSLVKIACQWWANTADIPPLSQWKEVLLEKRSMRHRLREIWVGLTQEEQFVLSEFVGLLHAGKPNADTASQEFNTQHASILSHLAEKGVCRQKNGWRLFSDLFTAYISSVAGVARGGVCFDQRTNEFFQGPNCLDNLTPLERSVLRFFIKHPRIRHTYTTLIESAWPEDVSKDGVSTEALYQVARSLRKKIEPTPSQPVYIINWRGYPEGGYQFYPEGRPQSEISTMPQNA